MLSQIMQHILNFFQRQLRVGENTLHHLYAASLPRGVPPATPPPTTLQYMRTRAE